MASASAPSDTGLREATRSPSIDSILSAASTTSTEITRFVRSVRAAHADLVAVTRELSDLRLLLELLRDEHNLPSQLQDIEHGLPALLRDCKRVLTQIQDALSQCNGDAGEWVRVGKTSIEESGDELETLRRSLGLALEVVNLAASQPGESTAGSDEARSHIGGEIDILRTQLEANTNAGEKAKYRALVKSYVDAVSAYLQAPTQPARSPGSSDGLSTEMIVLHSVPQSSVTSKGDTDTGVEGGLEVVLPDKQVATSTIESPPPPPIRRKKSKHELSQPFEAAGPWYPTNNIVLPFYSDKFQPVKEQFKKPREFLPPPLEPPRAPLPPQPPAKSESNGPDTHTQAQSPPSTPQARPSHSHSPSLQSESFDNRSLANYAPSADSRSERWSDQGRNSGTSNFAYPQTPVHTPRDPSITSISLLSADSPRSGFGAPRVPSRGSYAPSSIVSGRDSPVIPFTVSPASTQSRPDTHYQTWHRPLLRPGDSVAAWSPPVPPTPPNYPHSHQEQTLQRWNSQSSSGTGPSPVGTIQPPVLPQQQLQYPDHRLPIPKIYTPPLPPPTPPATLVEVVPVRHLTDSKGKPPDIFHIDTSPSSVFIATKHASNTVKIWSVTKNTVHCSIKTTSYVSAQARSREYFIRSHAILCEGQSSASSNNGIGVGHPSLIGIATRFGLDLEIYNFTKTSAKKVQTIDEAHRWAASCSAGIKDTSYAPLVVYQPKRDRIDRYLLSRHPGAKKPFFEDVGCAIELNLAGLPFLPKFPELAFSAPPSMPNSPDNKPTVTGPPLLIAAAGPRPGDPPRPGNGRTTILVAWQMTRVEDAKLMAKSPTFPAPTPASAADYSRPFRICMPEYPEIQTALPSCLVARDGLAVSIWIPANHIDVPMPGGKFRRAQVETPPYRFVVVWEVVSNMTRLFPIPNVQACVSPDCRLVAYCDPNSSGSTAASPSVASPSSDTTAKSQQGQVQGEFVIVDVKTGQEVWRWPDAAQASGFASFGQFENLKKITVFEFSADGKKLIVGDTTGGVGIYELREAGQRYELADMTNNSGGLGRSSSSSTSRYAFPGWQQGGVRVSNELQ